MVFPRLRRNIKQTIADWHQKRNPAGWEKNARLKVLLESWNGFAEKDWLTSLDQYFPTWPGAIQARFVNNFKERAVYTPEMQVYASTWLEADWLAKARDLKWVYLATGGTECLEDLRLPPGVDVSTAKGISAQGIAEHTLMLMLALDRRLDRAIKHQSMLRWNQGEILPNIRRLQGRTVGILGLGNNGQAIARLCSTLGMHVIGQDLKTDLCLDEIQAIYPPEKMHLLLSSADFVIVCLPLNNNTRGLIRREHFRQMKRDAFFINVARGAIVNENDLAWALNRQIIAGAAVDVLTSEPPPMFHPLRICKNLIITPHVAGNIYTYRNEIRQDFVIKLRELVERSL